MNKLMIKLLQRREQKMLRQRKKVKRSRWRKSKSMNRLRMR